MNQALTSRNYDGVFAHWQGGKVEMLRIIHRVKDGQVSERLVSLDGSGREFIRTGSELACYLPDKRTVLVEKRSDRNPLLGNFPTFDEASTAFYDIKEVRRTRIYRRDARIISVTPKDEFRYGYQLWIDEGTAMPLRTQLCDSRGRVIEQLILAEDKDLKINTNIPDTAFQPEVSTEGFRWLRSDPGVGQVVMSSIGPRSLERRPSAAGFPHDAARLPGDAGVGGSGGASRRLRWARVRVGVRRGAGAGQTPDRCRPLGQRGEPQPVARRCPRPSRRHRPRSRSPSSARRRPSRPWSRGTRSPPSARCRRRPSRRSRIRLSRRGRLRWGRALWVPATPRRCLCRLRPGNGTAGVPPHAAPP